MAYLSPTLSMLIAAVKKGSKSLNRDFYEVEKLQSSIKGHSEFVVSAVSRVTKNLQDELAKARPNFPFAIPGKPTPEGPHFVLSPLDGVMNFAHGIPHFSVSASIVDNGVTIMAVIFNPANDELYFAERGNGAFKEGTRNNERLRASGRKDLKGALIASLLNYKDSPTEYHNLHSKIIDAADNLRILGALSLDLAYVAAGKLDAAISLNNSAADMTAGIMLVREAGGSILELNQKDIRSEDLASVMQTGNVIAVNQLLAKPLHELLNK